MVAFIGNTLRGKVSGENFDESIASRQNSSEFSPVKILRYTVVYPTIRKSLAMPLCTCAPQMTDLILSI